MPGPRWKVKVFSCTSKAELLSQVKSFQGFRCILTVRCRSPCISMQTTKHAFSIANRDKARWSTRFSTISLLGNESHSTYVIHGSFDSYAMCMCCLPTWNLCTDFRLGLFELRFSNCFVCLFWLSKGWNSFEINLFEFYQNRIYKYSLLEQTRETNIHYGNC